MADVFSTEGAEQDLEDILAHYLAEAGIEVAQSIYLRIRAAAQSLKDFPERTRIGRVAGTRELVIARLPYIVVIQVDGDRVLVLNLIHTARKYPPD
ncbi:MAG: type II toxin-antitoxin system RelE/ParE family toxin [Betaproteobacteria bacterium]|nr:type II toxin-antitoxin system RelE/ParE family toxin [Betaproteobacteria bacterium]